MPGESRQNLPCRVCLGCRQAISRSWSVRCFHEALAHTKAWRDPKSGIQSEIPNSCVITLTYNDEHLPDSGYLRHKDFQRFMMRLRKDRGEKAPPVKFFMCGEYGNLGRCHFHALIFGESFDDTYETIDRSGQVQKMSYRLDRLWTQKSSPQAPKSNMGRATVDTFTFAGASYVAGYIAKKLLAPSQTGPTTNSVDTSTGETKVCHPAPEYRQMSGGLGKLWIRNPDNLTSTYLNDCVQINEWKFPPPLYYDRHHKKKRPAQHDRVLRARASRTHNSALEWDPKRCADALAIAHTDLYSRIQSLN